MKQSCFLLLVGRVCSFNLEENNVLDNEYLDFWGKENYMQRKESLCCVLKVFMFRFFEGNGCIDVNFENLCCVSWLNF